MASFKLLLCDIDGTLIESYLRSDKCPACEESGCPDCGDTGKALNRVAAYEAVRLLPGRRELVTDLREQGVRVALVTNQGGVAFGYQTLEQVCAKLRQVHRTLGLPVAWLRAGVIDCLTIDALPITIPSTPPTAYVALHHPTAKEPRWVAHPEEDWRKPGGGMIRQAISDYRVMPDEVLMVGDMESDEQAARAAGVGYVDAEEFFG